MRAGYAGASGPLTFVSRNGDRPTIEGYEAPMAFQPVNGWRNVVFRPELPVAGIAIVSVGNRFGHCLYIPWSVR